MLPATVSVVLANSACRTVRHSSPRYTPPTGFSIPSFPATSVLQPRKRCPVLEGFGKVLCSDCFFSRQIRNGSRNAKDAVDAPGGEVELCRGPLHQRGALRRERAVRPEFRQAQRRIGLGGIAVARCLAGTRRSDTLADLRGGFTVTLLLQK